MKFREDGQVGSWGVRFTGAASGHWLIQRILNIVYGEHCDGSAYPGESPLFPPPTRRYFEAWWVDEKGDVKVPKSLTTPPETGDPFGYGDDLWNFNTLSKTETRGIQSRIGNLYQVPTLPEGFAFGAVPEAGKLPAMINTPKDLGSPVAAERGADVEWDYKPKDTTLAPFQEIRTPV
jgi:hypothetical protein